LVFASGKSKVGAPQAVRLSALQKPFSRCSPQDRRRFKEMDSSKILLVDDEVDFLETLIRRLEKRNVNAAGVQSGEEALQSLDQHAVDVVVLDVKMPGMEGIQVLREIKKRQPAVEVIMLTGHANVEAAFEGMKLGAFDYLIKPVNIEELLKKIQNACEKKSLCA
jgi:DNA-binding NtrC family response regulator